MIPGALLVVAIFVAVGLLIATQRVAAIAEGSRATDDLARVLAEQTSRTLQPVDLTLREILGRLTGPGADTQKDRLWSSKAVFDLLVERRAALPQTDALVITDTDGRVVNFTRGFPPPPLDLSNRDHFLYLSTHDDHGLFVSAPVKTLFNGSWTVLLARRVNDAQGAFAGIITAVVTLAYLEDFYRAVTPKNGVVTVLRSDGLILVRYPSTEEQTGIKLPAASPWYKVAEAGGGSYSSFGLVSKVLSLVSVRPLREFPLVIDVSTTQAAVLAEWKRQTYWLLAGATVAASGLIFLLRIFGRQYNRLGRQNAELETKTRQFDAVLNNMSQGLTLFGADEKLLVRNHRYIELYHLSPQQTLPGTSLSDIIKYRTAAGTAPDMSSEGFLARQKRLVAGDQGFDVIDILADGRAVSMHCGPLAEGGWVATHEDVTEQRSAQEDLFFMARHDPLTELPNRTLFHERLTQAIDGVGRGTHCALLCLDLDRFKVINDTLGHPVGDGLLRAVSARLMAIVRKVDTVARLGGDEFAIILVGLKAPGHAAGLARRIVVSLCEPYEIDGNRIISGASIGVSIAPKDGDSSEVLLKNADTALYLAKTEGRGTYRFFEPEIDAFVQRERVVELDLRNALPAEHFELYYQPILDLRSGRVTGFEALIRWNHPVRGLVSPAEFIPIAEEIGLIVPIGAWALRTACQEATGWPDEIKVAVNLSPIQFRGNRLFDVVQEALAASRLAPDRLELEITESVLLESSDDRLALLHKLRLLGVRVALDDFGTGYSSLSYLRSFPFDKIKIDRSFIREVDTNKESAAIVDAIVGLGRSLGMTTVAEGVETEQQLASVRAKGCTNVQGYLFSRPRPARDVPDMIRTLCIPQRNEAIREVETVAVSSS